MKKYLIDTNIFIESAYRFYAFDICPGFWDFLEKISNSGYVKSIINVYDEIREAKQELMDFKEMLKAKGFFLPIENITAETHAKIATIMKEMRYEQEAIGHFSSGADYFLIALAYQESYAIVTQETKSGNNAKTQIKIPNVCERLKIECIDVADFLRQHYVQFILKGND